jgi:hypothetical protein
VVFTAYADARSHDSFASNASMTVDTPSGTTADLSLSQADLRGASINGSPGLIDVTSAGQVQSWSVETAPGYPHCARTAGVPIR